MARVLVAGGPGAGKTTLLAELGARDYATVAESAREIISERRTRGQSPRETRPANERDELAVLVAKLS